MSDFDLVVRNGTVATASDIGQWDIGVRGERIVALGHELPRGKTEIDAIGQIVLPGGIDSHCHLDQPMTDGSNMADDFRSGTISAAFGGTTTVIPFACQMKGESLRAAVKDYHRRAEGKPVIDYAFHMIVSDPNDSVLGQELPALIRDGYTSFKVYMTYDDLKLNDLEMLKVLALARREGAMVMIHAENADCITWLTEQLVLSGYTVPRYHAESRPPIVEREATHRAICLAELVDVPILIVHVSGGEAIDAIARAQVNGLRVYAETCPQYLFLTEEDLDLDGFEGAKCICSPPPRDKANQERVWAGLESKIFQVFSSDHAPFGYEDSKGKKIRGIEASFNQIPNGVPGIETRLPLLFSAGVGEERIDLTRFVELTATNPAKIYGLYPRKGTIAIGTDADLAIWDPEQEVTITNGLLHHNVDYTPYEGQRIKGWPKIVVSRGDVVVRDGELAGEPGRGRFLRCDPPGPARPRNFGTRA